MVTLAPLPPALAWRGGVSGHLELLDQTRLPHEVRVLALHTAEQVAEAIVRLQVRGAPAIGVAAAFGLVLGVRALAVSPADLPAAAREVAARLAAARPTAVNLRWALDRCLAALGAEPRLDTLLAAATTIAADEAAMSERLAAAGAPLVPDGGTVLTHCNTGRLATAGDGTALAVLFAAWRAGRRFRVLAGETRPLLQGSRLTALELAAAGIPVELAVDAAVPGRLARGAVQAAFVGADRIAANGDVANKVGTYGIALACAAHGVPLHVVAPSSTFDLSLATGASIPIEERDGTEVTHFAGTAVAPPGVPARNPAFDVTPAALIHALVTDRGVIAPPTAATIKAVLAHGR